ncbi:MAG: helix-turn-helix domain-containing protein [Aeromicrobium sp.]|uniref:PucR family transcriptional regulator n=1 Tax=Aeromicrobium sp. TaxID=1871063 RepID=UPI00262C5ADD|nr:helix-turn-helix domain-containing protein [Aeromicrobium sp.]MDF1706196.1 helix-turn-helix domain-containing protein [Aeromicrobium sp.]
MTSRLARGVAARDDADSWVVGLRPPGRRAESAIDPGPRLESALRVLGPGPVEWGLELATAMTEAMLAAVPELAVPDVEVELHRGSVAVVLGSLLELHTSGGLANLEVPEILLGPAELVGRGIGIEHMLRSIHTAHAVGMRAMMDECARLVPPELRFEESRRVADVLLELTGSLLDVMTQEFAEAHVAWSATSSAVRRELVQEILDPAGPGVTAGDVRSVLGYDLEAHHLAVVLWADVSSEVSAPVLESSARALVRRAGATGTLVVPVGRRQVWAWGSRTVDGVFEVTPADVPDGVRCALGVVGRGRDGFRTGHRQAMEVVGVAEHSVRDARLFRYADLELVCIAARDLPSARAMVQRELGALGALDDATTELRETLTCYLAVERSLNRSAEALHVARSTVAYRVRRAEELRGAPIEERRPQLQVALMLAEELGPQVLG